MFGIRNNFRTFLALSPTKGRGQGKVHCDEEEAALAEYLQKPVCVAPDRGLDDTSF
jgi:hypothetical protein